MPAQEEGDEAGDGAQTDAELSQLGFDDPYRWPKSIYTCRSEDTGVFETKFLFTRHVLFGMCQ